MEMLLLINQDWRQRAKQRKQTNGMAIVAYETSRNNPKHPERQATMLSHL
jgi:hypothetical protein